MKNDHPGIYKIPLRAALMVSGEALSARPFSCVLFQVVFNYYHRAMQSVEWSAWKFSAALYFYFFIQQACYLLNIIT